jgi:hypothetical protein
MSSWVIAEFWRRRVDRFVSRDRESFAILELKERSRVVRLVR